MTSETFSITSLEDLDALAKQLILRFEHRVILLKGDLGAGKTALVKALVRHLGSVDDVSSPTFSLINEYALDDGVVYHIDLYRLDDPAEVFDIGIEEYLYSGYFCFIEWPQVIEKFIDPPYYIIEIEVLENKDRKIILTLI